MLGGIISSELVGWNLGFGFSTNKLQAKIYHVVYRITPLICESDPDMIWCLLVFDKNFNIN
jgi:hypothetical protein